MIRKNRKCAMDSVLSSGLKTGLPLPIFAVFCLLAGQTVPLDQTISSGKTPHVTNTSQHLQQTHQDRNHQKERDCTQEKDLLPLAEGNRWQYREIYYETDEGRKKTWIVTDVHDHTDGRTAEIEVRLHVSEDSYATTDARHSTVENGGYLHLSPNVLYKAGLEDGDTYSYEVGEGDTAVTFDIEFREETISVPAGTFDVYVYDIKNSPIVHYLAPGIGRIKSRTQPFTTEVLIDYEVN